MNKATKRYIKECKLLLPVYGSKEKQYLNNIKQHLTDLSSEKDISYDAIVEQYGEPSNVITSYYEQEDYSYILKKVKMNSFIKKSIIVFIAIILSFLCYRSYILHLQYLEIKDNSNGYFEEVIG